MRKLSPTTGLQFVGHSTYENSYFKLGDEKLPPLPQPIRTIHSLPFMGRSLYSDSFKFNPAGHKADQAKPRYF